MANSCKYYKQQRQMSYDNGVTWIPLNEYRKGAFIEADSTDCASPSVMIYRWAKASTDDYVCVGYNKHYKEYYQYSTDNGATWQNVVPTSSRTSNGVIEYYSTDCGASSNVKFKAVYSDSSTYSAACDSNSSLTLATTRAHSTSYTAMTNAEIGNCVTSIGYGAFMNCRSLTSVTIPDSVISIGEAAFQDCYSLSSVTIPDSVTSIDVNAFNCCISLTSIIIPSGVTSIGNGAIYECISLTSCTFENGSQITEIPEHTFEWCSGLTSVNIPSGVTNIGHNAFNYCTSLTNITVNAVTPPTLGNNAFRQTNNCPIYVPSASVNAYKSASGWSTYADRIQAIP